MALPAPFLQHLRDKGYHSRSDKHSKALCEAIVTDLVRYCPQIAREAAAGQLVYSHNHDLTFGHSTWNTDLAIGTPGPGGPPPGSPVVEGMSMATPTTVRIAVEAKSVMTEHRKAIKNRKRDLEAHHQHVHDYDASCVAAGVLTVNIAQRFQSPLRPALTVHKSPMVLLAHCINEVNSISMTHGTSAVGLDAKCVLVLNMDNVDLPTTDFFTDAPAPQEGSPIHWDAFIQRICQTYTRRFP